LEQAVDLRFDLRTALFLLGEFEGGLGTLREAESLARTLGDQRRLGRLSVYMCHSLYQTGHPMEALVFGRNAKALGESLGDISLQAAGNLYFGLASMGVGDFQKAADLSLRVLQLLEGDLSRQRFGLGAFPAVSARGNLTVIFAELGKFKERIAYGQEGIRLGEAVDHPYSYVYPHWCLGHLHITRGDFDHAVGLLERGLRLSRHWNLAFLSAQHLGSLGYAYVLSGRSPDGIPLLQDALNAMEAMGYEPHQVRFLVSLGEAYFLSDRLEDAAVLLERALTLTRERGQPHWEAKALRVLAAITTHRNRWEHAEGHYYDALAVAERLALRPLAAHCHLGLGKLYRSTGKRHESGRHLNTATTMYREMDMRFWLEQAEAEISGLG
jgi:tetratricopeptide (TPR) repeat protein